MKGLFKKKEDKKSNLDDILARDMEIYLGRMKDIYFINGMKFESEDRESCIVEYSNALSYFQGYLENKFDDATLESGNALNINEEEMLGKAPKYAQRLFQKPKYSGLIYINSSDTYAHMHTDGENVTGVEGVQSIKGLDPKLQKEKINNIFNGMTVEEAAALLTQMRLVQKENSELYRAIYVYHVREEIRKSFYNDIIYAILKSNSQMKVTRARLFADTYGVDFDFIGYEKEDSKELKKKIDC